MRSWVALGSAFNALPDNFPGRSTNPVGFAVINPSLSASSGPFTSGSPGAPTIITSKDFDAGTSSTNIDANWVNFVGCRFQSNNQLGNCVSSGGTGCQNILFSYCSFTPRTTFYTSPPGALWPSATAGQGKIAPGGMVDDVTCPGGTKGYQFCFDCHNLTDGPITFDHCDFWGFGNAINLIGTSAQINIQDCWIHDCANTSPNSYHNDGPGYLNGGTPPSNVLIKHCTIASMGTTNAIALQAATSGYTNISMINNFLSGFNVNSNICTPLSAGSNSGIIFTDNVFGTDLPWVNGPASQNQDFVSPTNVWRRNKLRVLPGTVMDPGAQFSWTSADNGKFLIPQAGGGVALSTTDYTG